MDIRQHQTICVNGFFIICAVRFDCFKPNKFTQVTLPSKPEQDSNKIDIYAAVIEKAVKNSSTWAPSLLFKYYVTLIVIIFCQLKRQLTEYCNQCTSFGSLLIHNLNRNWIVMESQ